MSYKVKLNVFEGPFDLLVYLIENARMNIYDIQVSEITEQYMRYIDEMQQLDVALSSEFMVLAAELIRIKSRMLLPRSQAEPGALPEDPRTELVSRLLEYKRFRAAAEMLGANELETRRVFEKPQEDISEYTDNPEEHLKLNMDEFVRSFDAFLARRRKIAEIRHRYERVERERVSAEERMEFLRGLFREDRNKTMPFRDMIEDKNDRYDIALSFSSLLEMVRKNQLTAEQEKLFAEIFVKP